jgi:hypothetical protein
VTFTGADTHGCVTPITGTTFTATYTSIGSGISGSGLLLVFNLTMNWDNSVGPGLTWTAPTIGGTAMTLVNTIRPTAEFVVETYIYSGAALVSNASVNVTFTRTGATGWCVQGATMEDDVLSGVFLASPFRSNAISFVTPSSGTNGPQASSYSDTVYDFVMMNSAFFPVVPTAGQTIRQSSVVNGATGAWQVCNGSGRCRTGTVQGASPTFTSTWTSTPSGNSGFYFSTMSICSDATCGAAGGTGGTGPVDIPVTYLDCYTVVITDKRAQATNAILWVWNWGDKTPEQVTTVPTAKHTYAVRDVYTFQMRVQDRSGAISVYTGSIDLKSVRCQVFPLAQIFGPYLLAILPFLFILWLINRKKKRLWTKVLFWVMIAVAITLTIFIYFGWQPTLPGI